MFVSFFQNANIFLLFTFQLRGFCTLDHADIVPHMLHTENSTQIDIILDNLQTNKTFSNSRFAIELLMVGGGDPDILMFVDPKKSLDDEHTPGIFEVIIGVYYFNLFSLIVFSYLFYN